MFERFTDRARAVVVQAQEDARALHSPVIGPEHLLLAALQDGASPGVTVLRQRGLSPERVREEVVALGSGDADALRLLGIDLTAVRDRAEAVFGAGALDRPRVRSIGLLRRRDSRRAAYGRVSVEPVGPA